MKLYYSAGSCSSSCHISLEESGLKYEAIGVDWDNEKDPSIPVVTQLNPLGTLPIFITSEGRQLDQNLAIHTYVADLAPDKKLLPSVGTVERAEAMNWLSFVAADLHKAIGGLFSLDAMSNEKTEREHYRRFYVEKSQELLRYLDKKLEKKDYLMGKDFIVADAYAFIVLGWTKWLEIPIQPYKNIQPYLARVAARPAVKKVLKAEGLSD